MMAHDQRTGARGMPSFPAGLFSPRMPSQGPRVLVLTLFVMLKKINDNRELKYYDDDCNNNQEKNTAEALVSNRRNLKKWS